MKSNFMRVSEMIDVDDLAGSFVEQDVLKRQKQYEIQLHEGE